jgi:cyclophilin family peptidyl-prolyl cis-trans isomerase
MHASTSLIGLAVLTAAAWAQPAQTPDGLPPNLPPGLYALIHTSMGTITAELFEKETPNTVRNFIGLARGTRPWLDPKTKQGVARPLYDNITFHRVIPNFMIQTGDPTGTGAHNCGFVLKDEIVRSLRFDRPGRLAMANIGQPNTGACQFFITEKPFPDGNGMYTIFGQVVGGMELIGQIARVKRDGRDKPKEPVMLNHVDIVRLVEKPVPGHTDSGFGLYVNPAGDILTNSESVQGCNEVHLTDGRKLEVAATDRQNGLAVLHSGNRTEAFALFRAGEGIAAQEPVWTLATTPGFVNATADSHGDNRYLQVSGAPSGALGSPVLDTSGMVVGVLGPNAQNPAPGISSVIKSSVVSGFLDSAGVKYTTQPAGGAADRIAAVDHARRYTVAIQCWK